MFVAGNLLIAAGLIGNTWLPINKKLWSDSFSLFMAGLDFVMFAIFVWLVDGGDLVGIAAHGEGRDEWLGRRVPLADPVKISRLRLTNHSRRSRRLTVTAYVEWVLGASRTITAPFVVVERDEVTGAQPRRRAR